ncbi:methyltransferase family protein, partial [Streptomyces lonegramiae]
FGTVRNPIFTAMLVFAAGITLMTPNPVALSAFVVLLAAIELQVRVVEEPYLLSAHGQAYRDYRSVVGRFLPGIGRDENSDR